MYRDLLPAHRALMRDGVRATAITVTAEELHAWETGIFRWQLLLRASFRDGGAAEAICLVDSRELGGAFPHVGDVVPVRLAPDNPAHFDLDLEQFRADKDTEVRAVEARSLARAEEEQRRRNAAVRADADPSSSLSPELHAELADLKRRLREDRLDAAAVEARIRELDDRHEGRISRFLAAAERFERDGR